MSSSAEHGAKTRRQERGLGIAGVYARIGAKPLAMSAAIWHNWLIGAPNKPSLIAYDHEELII